MNETICGLFSSVGGYKKLTGLANLLNLLAYLESMGFIDCNGYKVFFRPRFLDYYVCDERIIMYVSTLSCSRLKSLKSREVDNKGFWASKVVTEVDI